MTVYWIRGSKCGCFDLFKTRPQKSRRTLLTCAYRGGGVAVFPSRLLGCTDYRAAGITIAKTADTLAVTSTSPELI
jgi:hypothetical protein